MGCLHVERAEAIQSRGAAMSSVESQPSPGKRYCTGPNCTGQYSSGPCLAILLPLPFLSLGRSVGIVVGGAEANGGMILYERGGIPMATIVEYTDKSRSHNSYPDRIISPPRPSRCCFSAMEAIGEPEQEDSWLYQYRRCRKCGFTVRFILREIPDEALIAELRAIMTTGFTRKLV